MDKEVPLYDEEESPRTWSAEDKLRILDEALAAIHNI